MERFLIGNSPKLQIKELARTLNAELQHSYKKGSSKGGCGTIYFKGSGCLKTVVLRSIANGKLFAVEFCIDHFRPFLNLFLLHWASTLLEIRGLQMVFKGLMVLAV